MDTMLPGLIRNHKTYKNNNNNNDNNNNKTKYDGQSILYTRNSFPTESGLAFFGTTQRTIPGATSHMYGGFSCFSRIQTQGNLRMHYGDKDSGFSVYLLIPLTEAARSLLRDSRHWTSTRDIVFGTRRSSAWV